MADPKKYKLTLSYDGTQYHGWQIQPNGVSIQGLIEQALSTLCKTPIRVIGSSRTDAGVHALGQVAHFTTYNVLDCSKTLRALNGMLPPDIRVHDLVLTDHQFHAQHGARSKEYHYHIWLERTIDPCVRLYRHHFHYSRFQLSLLQDAIQPFMGTHDFATFANVGGSVQNTVRTIYRISIQPQRGGLRLEFEGNGFLYKMVRNIVGTALDASIGKLQVSQINKLLTAKDRRLAGPAAPAKGLFLVRIQY